MDDMAWVVLGVWILVALIALPLGRHALTESPWLGVQVLVALAGLALAIVYVASGGSEALAWVIAGVGVLGAVVVAFAVRYLVSDEHAVGSARQQGAEEGDALLAGIEGPLFATASFAAVMLAVVVGA